METRLLGSEAGSMVAGGGIKEVGKIALKADTNQLPHVLANIIAGC